MTGPLYPYAPADAEAFVRGWLLALTTDPKLVGSQRWQAGMGLPYRAVSRIAGDTDLIADNPVVRVHTFGATYTAAARESARTHRRMLLLHLDPLAEVTLSPGVSANCAWLDVIAAPHEEPYGAESVVTRFVGEYALSLRLTPAPAT